MYELRASFYTNEREKRKKRDPWIFHFPTPGAEKDKASKLLNARIISRHIGHAKSDKRKQQAVKASENLFPHFVDFQKKCGLIGAYEKERDEPKQCRYSLCKRRRFADFTRAFDPSKLCIVKLTDRQSHV